MNIKNFHRVYFVGIGGIGMSALARWFNAAGYTVAGYDKTPSDITHKLINEGLRIAFNDSLEEIADDFKNQVETTLVIYTPAIPKSHRGLQFFYQNSYPVLKRSEALGLLVKENQGIGIAGTHGKTSISTTLAWLMKENCSAFLGGISKNLDSNVIINAKAKNVVIEADEFDRSFLTLHPQIAVVSSMDADHLDSYNNHSFLIDSFHQYIAQIKPGGALIYKFGLDISKGSNTEINYYTYSLANEEADFYASNIQIIDGFYQFDWHTPKEKIIGFKLGVPGLYNLENAVAALAAAYSANADMSELKINLESYQGVKRRFDYQIKSENLVFIDDYAHHPEEIKACINSVRHIYPDKKITGVFQPHLFTRTRDFADAFAESLALCDNLILTDIYPAREKPINGVDSKMIFEKIKMKNKQLCAYNKLVSAVVNSDSELIITMGAGDIDRLVPQIKKGLLEKYNIINEEEI
ncbi:MAG: UDP-N-acetylmuramate--L-alanine ligase [Salinivirgaceae bacterium]|nr:UDP-N-acetylmuramate--L-alanine ligase [Salinivirgaceae bacterium]